jgi:hypothetical protein
MAQKDNETNLEENIEQLVPVVKSVSKKQYDHLARAREMKKNKNECKEKNKMFILDQLNNINGQIGIVGTQINNLITKFDSHLISVESVGGMKRKREETELEKEIIEPPKKLDEKKDETDEVAASTDVSDGVPNFNYMVGAGKFIGACLAIASLYGYKKIMSNSDKLPAEYLYKNIN